ncbi:MAG: hypothetical protein AAF483_16745 [Planctomycetota bacterium]
MDLKIGFLSVRQHCEHGFFGGYLLLNALARPLEFHCTLPVKPSRAQELLYGPTLNDFVCGEQIAKALVEKAKIKATIIITDVVPILALQSFTSQPVAFLKCEKGARDSAASQLVKPKSNLSTQPLSGLAHSLQVLASESNAEERTREVLSHLREDFDIEEPFQRVVEALLEAHPATKAA